MPVEERERLARHLAADVAPQLRSAINRRDAGQIADLTLGLDRQELLALVVVLASQWPVTVGSARKRVVCWGCRKLKRHEGKGLCGVCRGRLDDATGRLRPPMPVAEAGRLGGRRTAARRVERKTERLEDFADLVSWGVSDEEAARRLGVSVATIDRYKTALRDGLQTRIPEHREYQAAS